ncbi:MAG: cob(I)yrinic acid a,c-diamide adenosyltransferase [Miltoncostaeaceae bacterium]
MVRLTRIYTGGGDEGETSLGDGTRVRKDSLRVRAFGEVDELNSCIGVARGEGLSAEVDRRLAIVQNDLFDLGADLSAPQVEGQERLRIQPQQVAALERWCDAVNEALPHLTSFILPGGGRAAAALPLARAVCRRAERVAVGLSDASEVNEHALVYLNRLSDLLFILARAETPDGGEVLWVPGASRGETGEDEADAH